MSFDGPLSWQVVDTTGSSAVPAARTYATLISYGRYLYLFGGYGESRGRFNDVFEFSSASGKNSWRLVPPIGEVPKPVYLHSAVQHRRQMIVFGGNNGKECNELYYYDLDTFQWSKGAGPSFFNSVMPPPRYGHAACVYGEEQLLIVGGCKSNNTYFKDTWSMDLNTKKWRRLEDLPLELAYHSLFTWQNRAYLFGGYNGKTFVQYMYVLDSYTGKWNILQASGRAPPPMCGAALVLKGNDVLVFGGYTNEGHTNNLYRFNMLTRVWTLIQTNNKPLARAYLQAAIIDEREFIFGGYNGTNCISDFRSIALPPPSASSSSSAPSSSSSVSSSAPSAASNPLQPSPLTLFSRDDFFNQPVDSATDELLLTYAGFNNYLSRPQISTMLAALMKEWKSRMANGQFSHQNGNAPSSNVVDESLKAYPFDTSRLVVIEGLGFSRAHVLKVMTKMHASGQNTRNIDLVADMCLKEPQSSEDEDSADPSRQQMERAELKQKVQELIASQEEFKTCKICFDATIDCALQDCGHLAVCTSCAESLLKSAAVCPICQRKIKAFLKVYWS